MAEAGRGILLIDDDEELGSLLTEYLGRAGYAVRTAQDGRGGLAQALAEPPALVLLDIMLPDLDGFEVLRELRKSTALPVIMLTARGEDIDRIVGLEMGADDYLPKPFNPRELSARIKAVLRRFEGLPNGTAPAPGGASAGYAAAPANDVRHFGALRIDLDAYQVHLEAAELTLTPIEFALLRELVLAEGRVLSRDALLDRVRGREFELFDRSIDVHVSHLRQKLGDDAREPRFIKTVRLVGYQFIGGRH